MRKQGKWDKKLVETKIEYLKWKLNNMDVNMKSNIINLMSDYINGSRHTKSFYHEVIWTYFNQVQMETVHMMIKYGEKHKFRFEELITQIQKYNHKWITLTKKDEQGQGIDGTSKFAKLVIKLMKEHKFNQRLKEVV